MDLGIVGKEEEVSVHAITDTNTNAAKSSIISPPSCGAADDSDDSHDTLGIHYEDEPQTGGVLPDATKSVGSISAITSPLHYIPTPQIITAMKKGRYCSRYCQFLHNFYDMVFDLQFLLQFLPMINRAAANR